MKTPKKIYCARFGLGNARDAWIWGAERCSSNKAKTLQLGRARYRDLVQTTGPSWLVVWSEEARKPARRTILLRLGRHMNRQRVR